MSLLEQLDKNIAASGGLIVSCQPVPGSPLDKPEIVAAMALAAALSATASSLPEKAVWPGTWDTPWRTHTGPYAAVDALAA